MELLTDHYEKHFSFSAHDLNNLNHLHSINTYHEIASLPDLPLDQIKCEDVLREWKRFRSKKSTDSAITSAFFA